MASIGSISSSAEQLVDARFAIAASLANKAESETFILIKALVALAKQAAGIDISATVPLDMPDIPTAPPFADKLVYGSDGMPQGAQAAIWASAVERAGDVLTDALARVQRNFTGFSAVSSIQYNALIQRELDRHTWHLADISNAQTIKAFDIEAEFAKFIVEKMAQWSLEALGADRRQALAVAELMLKQAEIQIKEIIEKSGLELTGYQGAADTAAHLAGSIMQSISVSASMSASGNNNEEVSATATNNTETRTGTSDTTTTSHETSNTTITGDS